MGFNKKNETSVIREEVLPLRVPNKNDFNIIGIGLWGWEEKIAVEKIQSEYTIKLIMGIDRNTPDYIWRGKRGDQTYMCTKIKD